MTPPRLTLIAILTLLVSACAQKPQVTVVPPPHIQMCADKSPSGVVHISPCDPLEVQNDPRN